VGQESPQRYRSHKGWKAGKVSEGESEDEVPEETAARGLRTHEEVVQRLEALEQQVHLSEVLLCTMVRDTFSQLASQTMEQFEAQISAPIPRPSTLEEA